MSSLMPASPRTGNATKGCYAAPLLDCDGKLTREHWVSRSIQREFGKQLVISGMPWARTPTLAGPDIHYPMLCLRHNQALNLADKAGLFLFRAARAAQEQKPMVIELDGEHLETFALKAAVGMMASGQHALKRETGEKHRELPTVETLKLMFGLVPMPDRWGFYHVLGTIGPPLGDQIRPFGLTPNHFRPPHSRSGEFGGGTVMMHGLIFTTWLGPLEFRQADVATYRPSGLVLNSVVRIGLRWGGTLSKDGWLNLRSV